MGISYPKEHFTRQPDAEAMAKLVMTYSPATDAEALKLLRARYPDCPLTARVAALGYLMRRRTPSAATL